MKIDFHTMTMKNGRVGLFEVYERCSKAFKKHGIQCRFYRDVPPNADSDADMFVLHPRFVPGAESLQRPVVVQCVDDSATTQCRFRLSEFPDFVRCFKVATVREPYANLKTSFVHAYLLEGTLDRPDHTMLTDEVIAKIVPGINWLMRDWFKRYVKRQPPDDWAERPLDVLFTGDPVLQVPEVARHRQRFCEILRGMKGVQVIALTCKPFPNYFSLSNRTKIIVGPWSCGEILFRDFEALLDECVLVKPTLDHLRILDDILAPHQTYVPCAIDGSDLEEVIRSVLADERYKDRTLRAANRQRVLDWWEPDKIVSWWINECGL